MGLHKCHIVLLSCTRLPPPSHAYLHPHKSHKHINKNCPPNTTYEVRTKIHPPPNPLPFLPEDPPRHPPHQPYHPSSLTAASTVCLQMPLEGFALAVHNILCRHCGMYMAHLLCWGCFKHSYALLPCSFEHIVCNVFIQLFCFLNYESEIFKKGCQLQEQDNVLHYI